MDLIGEYTKRYNRGHINKRSLTNLIVKLNRIADEFEWQTRDLYIEQTINKRFMNVLKETKWIGEVTIIVSHRAQIGEYYPVVSIYKGDDIQWIDE